MVVEFEKRSESSGLQLGYKVFFLKMIFVQCMKNQALLVHLLSNHLHMYNKRVYFIDKPFVN